MSEAESKPVEAAATEAQPVEAAATETQPVEAAATEAQPANTEISNADAAPTSAEPNDAEMADATSSKAAEDDAQATEQQTAKDQNNLDGAAADSNAGSKPVWSVSRPPPGMLRVGKPTEAAQKQAKIKSEPQPDTDDPDTIRQQVRFYLGDSNLPGDDFLWGKIGTENKPVLISLIHSFKRMRRMKPYSAVVAALKADPTFVVEGPEGEETIRRKVPCDPTKIDDKTARSIYLKGFGNEFEAGQDIQQEMEKYFNQFGNPASVRLRKGDSENAAGEKIKGAGNFKGSVFVEWRTKEDAEKFMAIDPPPQWKGHPLLILWKEDYMKQKLESIRNGTIEPHDQRFTSHGWRHRGRGRGNSRGNHNGGKNSDNWKERREQDQANGQRDRREHGGRGRGRGGRGRGGRGRGRGGNYGDRNRNAEQAAQAEQASPRRDGRPTIHTSKEGAKALKDAANGSGSKVNGTDGNTDASTNGKRGRDEDGAEAPPPAKKVDTKEGATEAV
ncbi:hypothetical protein F4780DRAFT_780349 [Xylariomycetidae sp. FL0641]|nr:hypothetical protein F4780DRAFT_780349 [Xylariomycetidae sp. FL0641]